MRAIGLSTSTSVLAIGLFATTCSPAAAQTPIDQAAPTAPTNQPPNQQANASTSAIAVAADESEGQTVVVTGSRIARPSIDNAQPTTTLDSATLNNRGYPDLARAINELPGFSVPDSSLIGGQGNGFGVGQSFINLYALGSQRTLTLVNG